MDSKHKQDVLKSGWITIAASFAFVALLALAGRANAVEMEHTVSCGTVFSITR